MARWEPGRFSSRRGSRSKVCSLLDCSSFVPWRQPHHGTFIPTILFLEQVLMQLNKSRRIAVLLVLISIFFPASLLSAQATETIQIDANASTTPFPHFWEKM